MFFPCCCVILSIPGPRMGLQVAPGFSYLGFRFLSRFLGCHAFVLPAVFILDFSTEWCASFHCVSFFLILLPPFECCVMKGKGWFLFYVLAVQRLFPRQSSRVFFLFSTTNPLSWTSASLFLPRWTICPFWGPCFRLLLPVKPFLGVSVFYVGVGVGGCLLSLFFPDNLHPMTGPSLYSRIFWLTRNTRCGREFCDNFFGVGG